MPTIELDGTEFCRFGSGKEPWINQLVVGRTMCPELTKAINAVKEKVRNAMDKDCATEEQDKIEADALRLARAGRSALNLRELSESESDESGVEDDHDHQTQGNSAVSVARCQRRGAMADVGKVREFRFNGTTMKAVGGQVGK